MNQTTRAGDISRCNCTAMRKASRRLAQMYDGALAPVGLKSTQFSILSEIARQPSDVPPTLRQLADAMVMDRSTMARNLAPLERDGYVSVLPSESDRRSKSVFLTVRGQAKLAEAKGPWRAAQNRFERNFGATHAAGLREVLLGIAANEALVHPASHLATAR
jgi:DNA-binding MarR family transcriptional regulator